jgi:hypothetical protein
LISSWLKSVIQEKRIRAKQYIDEIRNAVKIYCLSFDIIVELLNFKKANITDVFQLDEKFSDNSEEIIILLGKLNKTIEDNNLHSDQLANSRLESKNALRLQEIYAFCKYPFTEGKSPHLLRGSSERGWCINKINS